MKTERPIIFLFVAVKIGEDGKEVYGDWSNAFAYKVTASDAGTSEKPAAVSGVNVNTED
ncbi:MAG: hypothetical protein ACLTER_05505 [Ruminococcus sp.]